MTQRRKSTPIQPDKKGRYFRQIGWKMSDDFTKKVQPKFYLSRVREAAEFAYHRLGLLWDEIVVAAAKIVPADTEFFRMGQHGLAHAARLQAQDAERTAAIAEVKLPVMKNERTLYQAVDAYAAYAPQANKKEHGLKEAERTLLIKNAIDDLPLSQFNFNAIERIAMHWRSRPNSKKFGRAAMCESGLA